MKSVLSPAFRRETLTTVQGNPDLYPVEAFVSGSPDPSAPVLGIIGGIHGLERIGTRVAISFLHYLSARMDWDPSLRFQLERMRIFFVPLVNPAGMAAFTRCNGNGVDLMRNAPVDADRTTFLVGGHRISKRLPWYRGNPGNTFEGMEAETQSLFHFCEKQLAGAPLSVILDLHSGFGLQDQLWYPYARTRSPFPDLDHVLDLKALLDRVLPHHIYRFEPQSKHYTTHGDLWDHLYDTRRAKNPGCGAFIPLTLEMGSWNWVKKNPVQLLSLLGPYNPVKPHRQKRTLRRHLPLLDFLMRALTALPAALNRC